MYCIVLNLFIPLRHPNHYLQIFNQTTTYKLYEIQQTTSYSYFGIFIL